MTAAVVKNADQMITVANLIEDGIQLRFADGAEGVVPFDALPEIG